MDETNAVNEQPVSEQKEGWLNEKRMEVLVAIFLGITALLMVIAAGKPQLLGFVWRHGRNHASPNSGYPEAALAGILDCRFGGPHYYFGELFDKPYIGENARELTTADMQKAVRINRTAEVLAIILLFTVYSLQFTVYSLEFRV